ncbi:MAG TPA: HAD family hydrolase [Roseiflexaceae bacterium]|nr:HAD family hydrolase [Roseiflexaceae bacterium]
MTIKALIFDFDGLIFDTEVPEYQSWQEQYEQHSCVLPLEEWAAEIGTFGVFDPYLYLERQYGRPIDRAAIRTARHARFAELLAGQQPLPGVRDYLTEAKARGLKLGVASSSSRSWVQGHLEQLGLREFFDCVKTSDDVVRIKPDPELYQAALEALDTPAHAAVAFEDSRNGSLAATRAGIFCVAVPNQLTAVLHNEAANLQLTSLAEIPLGDLLDRILAMRARPASA